MREFRVEVFNLFNRTNFANPAATLPNALPTAASTETNRVHPGQPYTPAAATTFGTLTSTVGRTVGLSTNRQVQLAPNELLEHVSRIVRRVKGLLPAHCRNRPRPERAHEHTRVEGALRVSMPAKPKRGTVRARRLVTIPAISRTRNSSLATPRRNCDVRARDRRNH